METKNLKIIGQIKKLFFIVLATVAFTMLMSVSSVKAGVTATWDDRTSTLDISAADNDTVSITWPLSIEGKTINEADVRQVIIGNRIKSIGQDAFRRCTSLSTVTFAVGSSLETIGQRAFYTTALSSIEIPASVTSIGQSAFSRCTSLSTVTFAEKSKLTSIGIEAFYDCGSLQSITIPEGVTSIGPRAFNGCTSLASISVAEGNQNYEADDGVLYTTVKGNKQTLVRYPAAKTGGTFEVPKAVTSIATDAFHDCLYLLTVSFAGTNIGSIDDYAFSECRSLQSITIPEGVTSIGPRAFYSTALSSIEIPASVTSIGQDAFRRCTSLSTVTFKTDSSLETIGQGAFYSTALSSIEIPASVTSIGQSAFSRCTSLSTVTFAEKSKLTSIGIEAFYGCGSLQSITIPEGVTSIGPRAFNGCTSLASISVAKGNQNYEAADDGVLYTTVKDNKQTLVRYPAAKTGGTFEVPKAVTSIATYAFHDCLHLLTVSFAGTNIGSIDDYAFSECQSLQSITIPASVTSISGGAFNGCSSLATALVPNSCEINENVFPVGTGVYRYTADSAGNIVAVLLPANLGTIPVIVPSAAAILRYSDSDEGTVTISSDDNEDLTYLPSGFDFDGNRFFECWSDEMQSPTYYNAGDNIESIATPWTLTAKWVQPDVVFEDGTLTILGIRKITNNILDEFDKTAIKTVVIGSGATSIGQSAFKNCSSLQSITIPASVTLIGGYAFNGCSSLQSITIPASVTLIGGYVFENCSSLQSITIPEGVTSIGDRAFENCSSLQSITIPASVTLIGRYAFKNCSSLQSITIPEGVTSIGEGAFENCSSLQSITIPASVTQIDSTAFNGCTSLASISVAKGNQNYEAADDGVLYTTVKDNKQTLVRYPAAKTGGTFEVPKAVASIATDAFHDCLYLLTVSFAGTNIGSIDDYAFSECRSLQSITIPEGVTSIGGSAFQNCDQLQNITIPEGVTSIGEGAFENCSSLQSITIPASVTQIDSTAFNGCTSLASISVAEGNQNYEADDGVLYTTVKDNKQTLVRYPAAKTGGTFEVPKAVTSIATDAFHDCLHLLTVSFAGTNIGSIDDYAFSECKSLQSITIPASVTSISGGAFNGCSSLATALVPNSCEINENAFPANTGVYRYSDLGEGPVTISKADNENLTYLPPCNFIWNENQHFVTWFDEDDNHYSAGYAIEQIDGEWTLTALWGYTLNIGDPGDGVESIKVIVKDFSETNGSYVVNSGEAVSSDEQLEVIVEVEDGFQLASVTLNDNPIKDLSEPFNMEENSIIQATAEKKKCHLMLEPGLDCPELVWVEFDGIIEDEKYIGEYDIDHGKNGKICAKESVTMEGENYTFIGWFSANGTMVSSSATYTFTIYSDATYEARYKASGSKTVSFVANGQVIAIVNKNIIAVDDLPHPTTLYGLTFDGWKVGNEKYSDTEEQRTELVDAINALQDSDVQVTASYGSVKEIPGDVYDGQLTVTVQKQVGSVTEDIPSSPELLDKSKWISVNAPSKDSDTETFSHWELNGVEISRNRTVQFRVVKDCTLTAVYETKTPPSFVLKKATSEANGNLRLEADLTGVAAGSVTSVEFKYGESKDSLSESVSCNLDPDGEGTYIASIPKLTIGTDYYIQPVATLKNGSNVSGNIIQVEPESGYDRDEKASAVILESSANETGYTFVAYLSPPTGATIVKAGVIAEVKKTSGNETSATRYDMESFKARNTSRPWNYTLTTSTKDPIWVRPYVTYKSDGSSQQTLIGRRAVYP